MTTQTKKLGDEVASGNPGVDVDPHDASFATKMAAIYAARALKESEQAGGRNVPADESDSTASRKFYAEQARKLGLVTREVS